MLASYLALAACLAMEGNERAGRDLRERVLNFMLDYSFLPDERARIRSRGGPDRLARIPRA